MDDKQHSESLRVIPASVAKIKYVLEGVFWVPLSNTNSCKSSDSASLQELRSDRLATDIGSSPVENWSGSDNTI